MLINGVFRRFPCIDSQVYPMKSRIDVDFGIVPEKSLHRFPSLALKSRIDAAIGLVPGKSLHRFPSLALKSRIDADLALRRRSAGETILLRGNED